VILVYKSECQTLVSDLIESSRYRDVPACHGMVGRPETDEARFRGLVNDYDEVVAWADGRQDT
jgi:hypothetical protein